MRRVLVIVILLTAAVALIVTAGLYGWTELILSYFDHRGSISIPLLLGFGFLAGALSFFAPCAFVLFPGYVSYYLAQTAKRQGNRGRIFRSIFAGFLSGLGSVIFFLILGIGVALVGTSISQYLIQVKPLIALFFFVLGILLVTNISLDLSKIRSRISLHPSKHREGGTISSTHFFLYGFGYGLATTGCTFPIFVSLIVLPIISGRFLTGLLTFVSFASAMGLLMVVVTLLIGFSRDALIKRLMTSTEWIKRMSGVILILAGLYLGYFFIQTGM